MPDAADLQAAEIVPTVGAVREAFVDVLTSDRSRLAAAATDKAALGDLVDRLLYRARVEGGIELRRDGPGATAVALALPLTRDFVVEAGPASAARVADYLAALLAREPLRSRMGWEPERLILGALAIDLASFAVEGGEPVGARRDLRDAKTKADERAARQRAETAEQAFHEHVTDAIESDRAQRRRAQEDLDREPPDDDQLTPASAPVPVTPAAEPSPDETAAPWL